MIPWDALQGIWATVGGVIALGGVGVGWITSVVRGESRAREASAALILAGQTAIRDNLADLHADMDRRVDRLEQQSRDFLPGSAINSGIDHAKRNILTVVDGVRLNADRALIGLDGLRDRVTAVEVRHEQTTKSVSELKAELKETRHEIAERLDAMSRTQAGQFDQLCQSLREMREVRTR